MSPQQKQARAEIFSRLAVATREKLERQTLDVYIEATEKWTVEILNPACRRLQNTANWFPKVAEIHDACNTVVKEQRARREQYQLREPHDRVSPERFQEIMAQMRAVCKTKAMK